MNADYADPPSSDFSGGFSRRPAMTALGAAASLGPPTTPMSAASTGGGDEPMSFESAAVLLRQRVLDPPTHPGVLANVDGFEVLRVIGAGGMGVVVLARNPVGGSPVAIKLLKPELVGDARAVHQFLVEARHMSHLDHRHILKVAEVSDRPQGPYYVMPYLERGPLSRLIRPGVPLDAGTARRVAEQVADAVAYAHAKGLIHRDLKPANVLLDAAGDARVSDFGLARTVYNDSVVDVRQSQCEGTAPYMSPAVARGEAEDTRCDIYAIGATLYEMLTGRPPYSGRTSAEVIAKVLAGPPAPVLKLNPRADPTLVRICEGAMARDLRDRYAQAADVAEDLRRTGKRERPRGPHGNAPALPARRRVLAAGAVALTGVGLAPMAWRLWRERSGLKSAESRRDHPAGGNSAVASPAATQPAPGAVALAPHEVRRYSGGGYELAFAPDGAHFVACGGDSVKLWETATGRLLWTYQTGGDVVVYRIALSPDGQTVIVPCHDGTARVVSAGDGREVRPLVGHGGPVRCAAFTPDGRLCLTGAGPTKAADGSLDCSVRLWDPVKGEQLQQFDGHTGAVVSVAVAPKDPIAATASVDQTARLWELSTGRPLLVLRHPSVVSGVTFSHDGLTLLSGCDDGKLRLWQTATGRPLRLFEGAGGPTRCPRFSADGRLAMAPSGDRAVVLWDVATAARRLRFAGQADMITAAVFSPDDRSVLTGAWDRTTRLWRIPDPLPPPVPAPNRPFLGHTSPVARVTLSGDGRRALSGGTVIDRSASDPSVRLWDVATGAELKRLDGHTKGTVMPVFVRGDTQCLSAGADGTVRLWDLEAGKELALLGSGFGAVWAAAASPDGRSAVTGGADRVLHHWDMGQRVEAGRFEGSERLVWCAAFSADGTQLVSGGDDRVVRVWDVGNREEVRPLMGHGEMVSAAVFSPDGRQVLSAERGAAGRMILWDLATGGVVRLLAAPGGWVWGLAFLGDGRHAISAGADGMVRVWDLATGDVAHRVAFTSKINALALAPDGQHFLTAHHEDWTIRLSPVPHLPPTPARPPG